MPEGLALLTVLRALGEDFSADSLEERIIGQKKTYFIQEFGIDLDYRFRWYIYGPYSFALGSDCFELAAIYREEGEFGVELANEGEQVLPQLDQFFEGIRALPARDTPTSTERFWFELASSVHFLIHKAVPKARNAQEVTTKILQEKPEYTAEDVQTVLTVLIRHSLVRQDFA